MNTPLREGEIWMGGKFRKRLSKHILVSYQTHFDDMHSLYIRLPGDGNESVQ